MTDEPTKTEPNGLPEKIGTIASFVAEMKRKPRWLMFRCRSPASPWT